MIIGIAGGTGSGKTTLACRIQEQIGAEHVTVLSQDAYYRDRSGLPLEDRERLNYDHPDAFETPLLVDHLRRLRRGEPIPRLRYQYGTHIRFDTGEVIPPAAAVLLEGIMVLVDERVRDLLDLRVYVEADADLRLARRIQRDLRERSRTVESILEQYLTFARPMHKVFVDPSRQHADVVVSGEGNMNAAVRLISAMIEVRAGLDENCECRESSPIGMDEAGSW
jgi:uridine kinase